MKLNKNTHNLFNLVYYNIKTSIFKKYMKLNTCVKKIYIINNYIMSIDMIK